MFNGIRRAFTPSSNRTETPSSPPRRGGLQPASPTDPALQPRRGGNAGAAQPSPPRSPRNHNAFAALASLVRPPRHHATERASSQAGSSRPSHAHAPLTIAQDIAQWRSAAERDLPNMHANYGQYEGLNSQDIRPMYVRQAADAVARAAEQGLTHLKIEQLPAASLPNSIGQLPQLEQLSVSGTECTSLPNSIGDLRNLTHLNMVANSELTHLPEGIATLDKLTTLTAASTPLEALPQGIGNLRSLTELHLSCGSYEQLPQGFTNLSALKTLQISSSRPRRGGGQGLQTLPQDIGRLSSLETLNLSNQQGLRTIPDSLVDLARLRDLNLAGCSKLTELPRQLGQLGQLQQLETLTLKRNVGLRQLPDRLGDLRRLQTLDLTGCTNLRDLPDSLSRLPADCRVLVPHHLEARLHQLRPSQPLGQHAAGPGAAALSPFMWGPAALPPRRDRPIQIPQAVADPRVAAWKGCLAPFSRENGAKRFSQWMDAVNRRQGARGLSSGDAAKIERIVQAASTSKPLRTKLFAFATEHVRVQRNVLTGVTLDHVPAQTFEGVNEAHDVYLTHMVSDPDPTKVTPNAAYALLGEAIRERFGHMAPDEAVLALAGCAPRGVPSDQHNARPWPVLAAYVQTHDKKGQDLTTRGVDLIDSLEKASGVGDLQEHDLLEGADTVGHAKAMLLHDRYLAVATEVLAQHAAAPAPAINPARR